MPGLYGTYGRWELVFDWSIDTDAGRLGVDPMCAVLARALDEGLHKTTRLQQQCTAKHQWLHILSDGEGKADGQVFIR